jgi:hypothetical protein
LLRRLEIQAGYAGWACAGAILKDGTSSGSPASTLREVRGRMFANHIHFYGTTAM